MKLTEAIKRLTALGFKMGAGNIPEYGVTKAEPFDCSPDHVLAIRNRDVYISHLYKGTHKEFWYITSNINANIRKYRCRQAFNVPILNIFASGKTLEEAVIQFEHDFRNKVYNKTA